MSSRKEKKHRTSPPHTQYSIINTNDDEESKNDANNLHDANNPSTLIELGGAVSIEQKLDPLNDDDEEEEEEEEEEDEVDNDDDDESSYSSSSFDSSSNIEELHYSVSSEKHYAQTLKKMMEQELEVPEFENMMDDIVRTLINLAQKEVEEDDENESNDIDAAIKYLDKFSPLDAMASIGDENEKLATDFTDEFTERHENAAMEIMLEIVIKILNMRKLINDYPMIFVPLSFQVYQPKFMNKKTERKHKLKKQKRKRNISIIKKHHKKRKKHNKSLSESINKYGVHITSDDDDDESLSELSHDINQQIMHDKNLNNKFNKIESKSSITFEDRSINKAKSLPICKEHGILKRHKTSPRRIRTENTKSGKVRFQKTRSGLSLVLLPMPSLTNRKKSNSTKIFSKKGHFYDESTVFKHRLSDVSKDQINIARSGMISRSMQDIDEEYDEEEERINDIDHISNASLNFKNVIQSTIKRDNNNDNNNHSRREQKQSQEWSKLREWSEAFEFKHSGHINCDELTEQGIKYFVCEGCQTEIKLKDKEHKKLQKYHAGEGDTRKTFLFCDLYCETLRKYKEAIRQYAFEYEFSLEHHRAPLDLHDPDRKIFLFAMKDTLLVVDSALSRNAKSEDKKPHKPIKIDNNNNINNKSPINTTDGSCLRRERRLALLNLWREAVGKILPSSSIELDLSAQRTLQQLDGSREELPELLRYMDVTTFGRPLWYFCVDQLSTKDRPPLWYILEFLATELPTSMAINLLRSTRDALVRFHYEPLDNVCLKIIVASTYPIATALYLAAFMQSNANRDSSRRENFHKISQKYMNIATTLLSQIESDHLLAILIEIPSNINDLSILDIVIRFKLEEFLQFHRLQPIFMNMWAEYQYLSPSKPFRNREADSLDILSLCWSKSALFYYSAVGAFTLQCATYIFHVILVSFVTVQLLYPYKEILMIEWIVWVFNAGFVLYEVSELMIRAPIGYFQYYSNWIGFIIAINWIILALIRFLTYYHFLDKLYSECISLELEIDNVCYRNATATKVYMTFWALQLVLLWCRMAALLQRNRHAGPLLRMIMKISVEITNFALLLFLFIVGFVFAVYYIVGGDVDAPDQLGGGLNRISSVFMYEIQALLAAQEWSVIVSDDEDGFDAQRSTMVETCMVLLSIFGTLLLMNLFIAFMTITYESEKQNAKLRTNFARITHTIELDKKSAVMPPPLNILVFVLAILYGLFEFIITFVSCGYWMTKLNILYPINYSLRHELYIKENESKHRRRGSIFATTIPPQGSIGDDDDNDDNNNYNNDNNDDKDHDLFEISRAATAYRRRTYNIRRESLTNAVHCGCFIRLNTNSKSYDKNKCKNLNKQWKIRRNEEYCRHCRHSLSKHGDIDKYFDLFKYYQLLDEDDKKLLRLRLNKRNICPHCFRSYKSDKKRKHGLNRFQVILEVMSYYVFKILIWWWLLAILAIPAAIRKIYKRLNNNYNEQMSDFNVKIITNVSQTDPEYRQKVEEVIKDCNDNDNNNNNNNNNNKDGKDLIVSPLFLSNSTLSGHPQIDNNNNNNNSIDESIKQEFQSMIERKHEERHEMDEKMKRIENQMYDLKHLVMAPQRINNNKKVTFNTDISIKNNELKEDDEEEEEEEEEDDDNHNHNDKITPRVVSHARSNIPMTNMQNIDEFDIDDILAKNKSTRL